MTNSPTSGGINQTQTHMHTWTDTNTQRDEKWEVKNVCGNTQINSQAIYTSAWKRVCVCVFAHCPAVILSIPNKPFQPPPLPPPHPPRVSHNAPGQVMRPPPLAEGQNVECVCERMDKGEEWMRWFISLLFLVTPFERDKQIRTYIVRMPTLVARDCPPIHNICVVTSVTYISLPR